MSYIKLGETCYQFERCLAVVSALGVKQLPVRSHSPQTLPDVGKDDISDIEAGNDWLLKRQKVAQDHFF